MPKTKGSFTKETSKKALEARYGLKLLVYMRPLGKKQVITGKWRGEDVNHLSKENKVKLLHLFDLLKEII